MKRFLLGLHEPGGEWLMADYPGPIVFTHQLGDNPADHGGFDYRQWSDQGHTIIARLNYGYGSAGTIPEYGRYNRFAVRCAKWVDSSEGCGIWVVGNEPNHPQERPGGIPITPLMYADCYTAVWHAIKGLAAPEKHQVVTAPIAPWNNQTGYPGNERGDWIWYFTDMLQLIMMRINGFPGGIGLHTYTHGHDAALITDESTMDVPFQDRRYNFRCYQDFMEAIPGDLRHLPVYITETDANDPWSNINNGWILGACKEIGRWNETEEQPIQALVIYRWPRIDKWYMVGKQKLHKDFRAAVLLGLTTGVEEPEPLNSYFSVVIATSSNDCGIQFCHRVQGEAMPHCREFFDLGSSEEKATLLAEWLNSLGLVRKE